VTLIGDCLGVDDMEGSGLLWTLADKLPESNLPEILDGILVPLNNGRGFDRRVWEVASFYARFYFVRGARRVPSTRAVRWSGCAQVRRFQGRHMRESGSRPSRCHAGRARTHDRNRTPFFPYRSHR